MAEAMTPVSKDSLFWRAWEAYTQSSEYANTKRWATQAEPAEGSLWAAFEAGFNASPTAPAVTDAMVDLTTRHAESIEYVLGMLDEIAPRIGGADNRAPAREAVQRIRAALSAGQSQPYITDAMVEAAGVTAEAKKIELKSDLGLLACRDGLLADLALAERYEHNAHLRTPIRQGLARVDAEIVRRFSAALARRPPRPRRLQGADTVSHATLTFVLPLPPNLANGRMHWRTKDRERTRYLAVCDTYQLDPLCPRPPRTPFPFAMIDAELGTWRAMDHDNAMARTKWAIDWLVSRGYLAGDGPQRLAWVGVPRQVRVGKSDPRTLTLIVQPQAHADHTG